MAGWKGQGVKSSHAALELLEESGGEGSVGAERVRPSFLLSLHPSFALQPRPPASGLF